MSDASASLGATSSGIGTVNVDSGTWTNTSDLQVGIRRHRHAQHFQRRTRQKPRCRNDRSQRHRFSNGGRPGLEIDDRQRCERRQQHRRQRNGHDYRGRQHRQHKADLANNAANSTATVVISGAGSNWTTSAGGYISVGEVGSAALTINNGGTAYDTLGSIADTSGATGTVLVDGNGSLWSNTGDLRVGYRGSGTLTVQNGGLVKSLNGTLGVNSVSYRYGDDRRQRFAVAA